MNEVLDVLVASVHAVRRIARHQHVLGSLAAGRVRLGRWLSMDVRPIGQLHMESSDSNWKCRHRRHRRLRVPSPSAPRPARRRGVADGASAADATADDGREIIGGGGADSSSSVVHVSFM